MKLSGMVAMVFLVGVGGTLLFFSCGKSDSADDGDDKGSAEVKDAAQPFQIAIATATVDFPASALDAGTKVEIKTAATPAEFTVDGVTSASTAIELKALDATGAVVEKARAPMTVAISLAATPALADVEKTAANICMVGIGVDGVKRRWANGKGVDQTTGKVKVPAVWFGLYQALFCGDRFTAAEGFLSVNEDGTAAEEANASTGTDTGTKTITTTMTATNSNTNTNTGTNATCNDVVNGATPITPSTGVGDMEPASGGTILDGTYYLVGVEAYPGSPIPTDKTAKDTMVIQGTTMQYVSEAFSDPETRRSSSTATRSRPIT